MSTGEFNPELPPESAAADEVLEQSTAGPAEEVDEFGFTADELVGDDEDEDDDDDEDVSPIDEFVDEDSVPDDGEEIEMDWYILKVQVNRERTICEQLKRRVSVGGLDRYFGDIVVPTEDVREFNKAGKQRVIKRKLYPGYVVVNICLLYTSPSPRDRG